MNRFTALLTTAAVVLAIVGCEEIGPIDPDPTTTTPIDTNGNPTAVTLVSLYDTPPDVANCVAGTLKQSEQMKVVNYVNAIRALHGLPPVQHRAQDDARTAEAALIIAANESLSHTPAPSSSCWTQDGYDASEISNLGVTMWSNPNSKFRPSEYFVDLWLKDSMVAELGHRRWLLDPFLKHVSFGRADVAPNGSDWGVSGSAISVVYDEHQNLNGSSVEYVAYPYQNYPASLYNGGLDMSFSVLADRTDFWSNDDVDYSNASITITTASGTPVSVSGVTIDNRAFGLANCLSWRANVQPGTRYDVRIQNVRVNGSEKNYDYWFNLGTTVI